MIGWWMLVVWQATPVTVGDTVWITRQIAVPNGRILRPQVWDLGDVGLALGAPEVVYRADSATVRYPITLWFPGLHRLTVPGPIIVNPAGGSDTLRVAEVVVEVGSVLPADRPKAALAPRGAAPLLPQSTRSLLPVGVLLGLVALVAATSYWGRARGQRQRHAVGPLPAAPEPAVIPVLDRWEQVGETRTALDGWAHLIERELARRAVPAAPAEVRELLAQMASVGFRSDPAAEDVGGLIVRARAWLAERH